VGYSCGGRRRGGLLVERPDFSETRAFTSPRPDAPQQSTNQGTFTSGIVPVGHGTKFSAQRLHAGTVYVKANLFEVENTDADILISSGIRKPTE
jgi:hypothetical protein